jgi:hypothetical protein
MHIKKPTGIAVAVLPMVAVGVMAVAFPEAYVAFWAAGLAYGIGKNAVIWMRDERRRRHEEAVAAVDALKQLNILAERFEALVDEADCPVRFTAFSNGEIHDHMAPA